MITMFYDFLRHANAVKVPGMDEHLNWARPLSEEGIRQALSTRTIYADEEDRIKVVAHSPAPRVLCTAAIAIGNAKPSFVQINSLWVQRDEIRHDGELLWRAFDAYGYDIEAYHKDHEQFGIIPALHRFADRAFTELTTIDDNLMPESWDNNIGIIAGHAIFLNFLAYRFATTVKEQVESPEELLHIELAEAERIRLTFEGSDDIACNFLGFTRSQPPVKHPSGHPDGPPYL